MRLDCAARVYGVGSERGAVVSIYVVLCVFMRLYVSSCVFIMCIHVPLCVCRCLYVSLCAFMCLYMHARMDDLSRYN